MKTVKSHKSAAARLGDERGSFAVSAMWILMLLTLMGIGLSRTAMIGLRMDTYLQRSLEAKWLARAGIRHAIAVLEKDIPVDASSAYDAFTEEWAQSPALFQEVACGEGQFEVAYQPGSDDAGLDRVYGILDENRRVNINRAPAEVLLRLPGMNPAKAAALLDWRDEDDNRRKEGAENAFYQSLANPYPCKNAPLDVIGELALVRGFSEEDVQRLSDVVTVHGDGRVNINTAPAEVLEYLGIRRELARGIVKSRRGKDGISQTHDDVVYKNPVTLVADMGKVVTLKAADQLLINGLVAAEMLDVRSTHFTISATGITMNGQIRQQVSATVRRTAEGAVDVLIWAEQQLPAMNL